MKFDSVKAEYEYEAMYIGAHIGGGYKYAISEKLELDASGKYFFINYGEKEVELTTPDRIKFEGISSHKVSLGAKVTYKATEVISPYVRGAVEYELGGKADAKVAGLNVEAPSITGVSGAGEVGIQGNIGRVTIELGGSGYAGVRTGANGMLKVKYNI
jgi:outer membrane autotransporter protein